MDGAEIAKNIRMSMAEEMRIGTLHEIYRCVLINKGVLKVEKHGDFYQIYGSSNGPENWYYLGFLAPKRDREYYR